MKYDYDCCVIGGGAAGLTAAKGARGLGKKVVIVESNRLGGECTLTGCIPSKALIKSAQVMHYAQNLKKFGIRHSCELAIDTSKVMDHVRSVVQEVYNRHTPTILQREGIDVEFGDYQFYDPHTLICDTKKITAQYFVICTGSRSFVPPIDGLSQVAYLTNETLFSLQELPKSILILGGGPIGMEMASALNRLGVIVTVLEIGKRVLPQEDEELADLLANTLIDEGVILRTGMRAEKIFELDGKVTVNCIDTSGTQHSISAEKILVAVGRRANVERLGLEHVHVQFSKWGITVDAQMKTTQKNIFACGDVVGPYRFSHMANYQARVAVRNMFIPFFKEKIHYNHLCWITFTAPEIASAGFTQEQARERYGNSIKIYRQEYRAVDRAYTEVELTGLAKFICNKKGYLIGAHICGAHAGELIHEIQLGKKFGIKFANFYKVIHAYPAYSDVILHAAKQAYIDRLKNNFFVKLLRVIVGK